jgi:hypothetical protein
VPSSYLLSEEAGHFIVEFVGIGTIPTRWRVLGALLMRQLFLYGALNWTKVQESSEKPYFRLIPA